MAKRKVSKSSDFLVNKKYYGSEEPSPDAFKSISGTIRAFTWYHNMKDYEDARKYLKEYFVNDKHYLKQIDRIPEKKIPLTSAWICRMVKLNHATLDLPLYLKVTKDIDDATTYTQEDEVVVEQKIKTSIQERVKERVSDIIGDVEELVDKGELFDMYEWLQKKNIPAAHASKISDFYKPLRDEYFNAIKGDREGYEHYSTNELKLRLALIHNIVEDCYRFSGNIKKTRKPRKKKEISSDKLLRNIKYQKESKEYKLTSVNPTSVLGSQELWTFNTRYNVLTVFRARGPAGLSIKRTTITGYDEATTIGKRLGRKAEPIIKDVISGGKVTLRKIMDNIKSTKVTINGRLNENTILLKVQR